MDSHIVEVYKRLQILVPVCFVVRHVMLGSLHSRLIKMLSLIVYLRLVACDEVCRCLGSAGLVAKNELNKKDGKLLKLFILVHANFGRYFIVFKNATFLITRTST